MNLYIEQGRFGEFVAEILLAEKRRKEETAKKENEDKWWSLYLHSYADKPYNQWKAELTGTDEPEDGTAPDRDHKEDVDSIIKRLFKR